jgi:hypothetical protein
MRCLDQNQELFSCFHFFCVTPHRGMPHQEDHSLSTILLIIGKSPVSTSLLIRWSPHRDPPSSLFPFLLCATPQVRHSLLASFMSHLHCSTHKGVEVDLHYSRSRVTPSSMEYAYTTMVFCPSMSGISLPTPSVVVEPPSLLINHPIPPCR